MALWPRVRNVVLAFPLLGVVACITTSTSSPSLDAGSGEDSGISPANDGAISASDSPAAPWSDASTSTCAPANVQGYTPKWVPPSYAACLATGDPHSTACAPWATGVDAGANAACMQCLTPSSSTDAAWGPLVNFGSAEQQINVAGCLAIVLHDTGSGCAGNFQAFAECEAAACAANCVGATSQERASCQSQADNGGCSSFLAAAACVGDAGAATAACLNQPDPHGVGTFPQVAAVFCLAAGDGG
jgi:hypothetical protein